MNRTVISPRDVRAAIEASVTLQSGNAPSPPLGADSEGEGVIGGPKLGEIAAEPIPVADRYLDRLVKYIPPDVIAAFLAMESAIQGANPKGELVLSWVIFAVILLATPFYLRKLGGVTKPRQIAISTVAFVVWAYAFNGLPFSQLKGEPIYATLVMGIYTFLVPLIEV